MSHTVDHVIQSCIASTYVFSKTQFDTAKDTAALQVAAELSAKALTDAVEYELQERIERMLVERIEDVRGKGEWVVRVGDTMYRIEEY